MKKLNMYVERAQALISGHPQEVLAATGVLLMITIVAVVAALTLAKHQPDSTMPEPAKVSSAGKWKFAFREEAGGGQVCDVYRKGPLTQARCYGKGADGKWTLKNVF